MGMKLMITKLVLDTKKNCKCFLNILHDLEFEFGFSEKFLRIKKIFIRQILSLHKWDVDYTKKILVLRK